MDLVLPKNYVEVTEEEMMYLEGGLGSVAIVGIIAGCVTITVGAYNIGYAGGLRAYYAGLRNNVYQNIKWQVRAGVLATFGFTGAVILTGFENGFYSKC